MTSPLREGSTGKSEEPPGEGGDGEHFNVMILSQVRLNINLNVRLLSLTSCLHTVPQSH